MIPKTHNMYNHGFKEISFTHEFYSYDTPSGMWCDKRIHHVISAKLRVHFQSFFFFASNQNKINLYNTNKYSVPLSQRIKPVAIIRSVG